MSLSPPTPPGMGRGPHGHRGHSAARPVGSASRSVSEVAVTQRPATGAASAWARAGRSGELAVAAERQGWGILQPGDDNLGMAVPLPRVTGLLPPQVL